MDEGARMARRLPLLVLGIVLNTLGIVLTSLGNIRFVLCAVGLILILTFVVKAIGSRTS